MPNKKDLSLGIIGFSPGNGHPFSWSAICNGYEPNEMEKCGFPVIPKYLKQQEWPSAKIPGVKVDYVWTPNNQLSERIAKASLISNVVSKPEDMLDKIDAVLLARDDAENHLMNAQPFLEKGLPIYIDKPISLSRKSLLNLWGLQSFSGQIFSCSSMSFASELHLTIKDLRKIGAVSAIEACIPNSWEKYSVHLIEPLIQYFGHQSEIRHVRKVKENDGYTKLSLEYSVGPEISIETFGARKNEKFAIKYHGPEVSIEKSYINTFVAFRKSLKSFIHHISVKEKTFAHQFDHHDKVVSIIEMGL